MNSKILGALCALLTIGRIASGQPAAPASGNQVTVPFSDPSRPGTVKVNVLSGSISVKVGSGRDVIVNTTPARDADDDREREREREREARRNRNRPGADDPSSAGMRRLTQPAGVNIEEENNVVSVSAPVLLGRVNIALQVPAATSLVLRAVNGGEVSVEGVNGTIEVNNVNGSIRLADVGGAVIAHATNGRVSATLRQIAAGKPMSFTSFNGDVDVTLPGSAKANVKMRSDRGDVYTDFDVQTRPAPAGTQSGDARRDDNRNRGRDDRDRNRDDAKDRAKYRLEMDRSIYGTVNGGGPDFELRTFNGDIFLRRAR
jgi:hypothetical protein